LETGKKPERRSFNPSPRYAYLSLVVGFAAAALITFCISGLFAQSPPLLDYAYLAYALFFLLGIFLVYAGAKRTVYEVGGDGIKETKGIFFRRSRAVSFGDINNVRLERSIGDKIAGLGRVYVDTPEDLGYEMVVKGLTVKDANEFAYLIEINMEAGKK